MNLPIALLAVALAFLAGAGTVALVAYLADRAIRRKHGLHTDAQVLHALAAHEAAKGGAK